MNRQEVDSVPAGEFLAMLLVNKVLDLPFDVAIDGAKQSGIGRQQGAEALEDFTQTRVVNARLR